MQRGRRIILGVFLAAALAGAWLLRNAGARLLVSEPLDSSQAVVVLGGQVPFRAIEAAAIYRQGLAPEVWVTQGAITEEDAALTELGIERPPDHVYSVKVLERSGVPDSAIRVLTGQADNTASEVRIIARAAQAVRAERLILITSKYHSRRVRVLWNSLAGDHSQAIVRYTPLDPFEPKQWWRTSSDAMAVSREWFGLLNAWLGFPVSSVRGHSSN